MKLTDRLRDATPPAPAPRKGAGRRGAIMVFLAAACFCAVVAAPGQDPLHAQEAVRDAAPGAADKDKPREADIMALIMQLQDEVKQLRRELNQIKAERATGAAREERERTEREGREHPEREGARKRDEAGERDERDADAAARDKLRKKERKTRKEGLPEGVELKSAGVLKEAAAGAKGGKITFVVKEDGKDMEMTCVLSEGAVITLNGNAVELADLRPGDHIECQYVLKGEKMVAVARSVAAKRGSAMEKGD